MLPVLSIAEQVGRYALRRRGVKSRSVETRGGCVHVYDASGKGRLPPVVLLHGIGSSATSFAPLIAQLQRDVRGVVAPELPGHGFSDAPGERLTPELLYSATAEALDGVRHDRFVLFGNSLGGAVAIRYALERSDRVRALVLVSPAGARMHRDEWNSLVRTFDIETVEHAKQLLERIYFRAPWFVPFVAREFRSLVTRPAIRHFLESVTIEDTPSPEQLGSLRMPILLLWGQGERLLPSSNLEYFRSHLPAQTRLEQPPSFGHCPHIDSPRALAQRIVEFLRTLPADC